VYPFCEMFMTCFEFHIFFDLEILAYIYNEIYWEWDKSKMKFIYVSYMPYAHTLKAILCNIFSVLVF
jgi:hypothetical protein